MHSWWPKLGGKMDRSESHHWLHGWMRVESSAKWESSECNKQLFWTTVVCREIQWCEKKWIGSYISFEGSTSAKLDVRTWPEQLKSCFLSHCQALWATENTWYELVVSIYMTPWSVMMMSPMLLLCCVNVLELSEWMFIHVHSIQCVQFVNCDDKFILLSVTNANLMMSMQPSQLSNHRWSSKCCRSISICTIGFLTQSKAEAYESQSHTCS